MPLEQSTVETMEEQLTCPECGDYKVTPMDNPRKRRPNDIVKFGGIDEIEYQNVCWECGWGETVTVTIERREH